MIAYFLMSNYDALTLKIRAQQFVHHPVEFRLDGEFAVFVHNAPFAALFCENDVMGYYYALKFWVVKVSESFLVEPAVFAFVNYFGVVVGQEMTRRVEYRLYDKFAGRIDIAEFVLFAYSAQTMDGG